MARKKILVLFPNQWDLFFFEREDFKSKFEVFYLGKDFFHFPEFLKLPFFNVEKFARRIENRAKAGQIV